MSFAIYGCASPNWLSKEDLVEKCRFDFASSLPNQSRKDPAKTGKDTGVSKADRTNLSA